MATVTLHTLLWGLPSPCKVSKWSIDAHEVPAIGLPTRVAAALLLAARSQPPPKDWRVERGPLVWRLSDSKQCLAEGRRLQLGCSEPKLQKRWRTRVPTVRRSERWGVPPHAAYYLPLIQGSTVHAPSYVLYCDVLLFLTALDGGESILDSLYRSGLAGVSFEDRWAWRSRVHLSEETWGAVDKIVRWGTSPTSDATASKALTDSIKPWRSFSYNDFLAERVDLLLQQGALLELVRTVRPFRQSPALPPELRCIDEGLSSCLKVRIAQISQGYSNVVNSFPSVPVREAQAAMEQVAAAFDPRTSSCQPDLLILPELAIPQNEVSTLRRLVAKTGIAALAGLYWRELPAAYPSRYGKPNRRWIVNEAELVIPLGHGTPGPSTIHWFRVRKPVPAHIEDGLAQALTRKFGTRSHFLGGRRWYRFVHRRWGDFSIAICADLIDAEPWRIFRGELLHLFTVAFNKDVELYDSLTWVRAYESYVNVVSVNHGEHGGSFVWTPRRSYEREVAKLRGRHLFLLADVDVPVRSLLNAQADGVKRAVDAAERLWLRKTQKTQPFKAPPPGYRRRN